MINNINKKSSIRKKATNVWRSHPISILILSVYSLCVIIPFIFLIYNSLRTKQDFLTNTLGIPKSLGFQNYVKLFTQFNFQNYLLNSIIILIFTLALLMFFSLTVSYGIGRYDFKFRKGALFYFLLGLMFPIQLSIIPVYILIRNMGLYDTQLSAILVIASGISMPVLLLTGFFRSLPNSIYESAKIDGASEWRIFIRIMVPMASAVIFSTCIIMSVTIWNQFFIPLIFLQNSSVQTVPLIMLAFTTLIFGNCDVALAGSVLATLPLLIAFFVFSKRIISSIVAGGVKG